MYVIIKSGYEVSSFKVSAILTKKTVKMTAISWICFRTVRYSLGIITSMQYVEY